MSPSDYTRDWQAKRLAAGLCQWCGLPRAADQPRYCQLHLAHYKRLMRECWRRHQRRKKSAGEGGPGR